VVGIASVVPGVKIAADVVAVSSSSSIDDYY